MLADNGVTAAPVLADAPIELVAAPDVVPALLSEPVEVEILAASSKAHTTGLTDQTNYLPPRRVITVYLGLSIGLVCSILEQTVVRVSSSHTTLSCSNRLRRSPLLFPALHPTFIPGKRAHGSLPRTYALGARQLAEPPFGALNFLQPGVHSFIWYALSFFVNLLV
jgi:hypothetical protein